jgi:Nucleotidyl transferase AbiEii toxin, Type IV TA system
MSKPPRDIGASVRARLLTLSRDKGQPFDLLLTRYAIERLLYRLSVSAHRDRFVLKGAMLMTIWFDDPHRPTRDVDLLGYGDSAPEPMLEVFRNVCAIKVDDGVVFDAVALRVEHRGCVPTRGKRWWLRNSTRWLHSASPTAA